jgi:Rrf2 family protein
MKLTRASSYALHAVVAMAGQKENAPVASHLTARAEGVPERFLLKVLNPLVRARILHSIKGPHGGYRLARSPADISLLEIVEAVDGPIRAQVPPVEAGDGKLDKRLEKICEAVAEEIRNAFAKVRVSDLAGKGGKSK